MADSTDLDGAGAAVRMDHRPATWRLVMDDNRESAQGDWNMNGGPGDPTYTGPGLSFYCLVGVLAVLFLCAVIVYVT